MLIRKRKDPELVKISQKMEEIKDQNRKAVEELKDLNKTLREMQKRLKTLKGL